MEQLDLTTPLTTPNVTYYRVTRVYMDFPAAFIKIDLVDTNSRELTHTYTNSTATTFMVALNKANLSVKSLHRRIIERLQADGVLPAGTISGSPD